MRVLALFAAAASLVVLLWFAGPMLVVGDAQIAEHLVERVADLGDAEAAGFVTGISLEDERGLRGLVELAASSRLSIALTAQTRLDDWIESLQRRATEGAIDTGEAGRLLLSVADELAARADELGTGAAAWAARLGRKLAESSELVPPQERLVYFQQCDAVLLAGAGDAHPRRVPLNAATSRGPLRREHAQAPMASVEERLLAYAMQRGPLSTDPTLAALDAAAPAETSSASLDPPLNRTMIGPGEGHDGANGSQAPTALVATGPSAKWRTRGAEVNGRPSEGTLAETIDVPPPDAAHAREEELVHAPLAEVIAVLVGEDRFESASAQAALRRRGMSPIDLEIARRLPGSDADARRTLLDEVAKRPGASLTAWLQYFATDEAADVRLRALSLLATSRDETVTNDVYTKAVRDDDPRIRALAERLRGGDAPSR